MLTTEGRTTRRNYANLDIRVESVTPLYDNLLVRRLHDEEARGMLFLPDMQQTADGRWVRKTDSGPRKGVVVRAGRGDKTKAGGRKPMAVGEGDVIIYPRFESSHVVIGGEPYTFVHEADVMAVVDA